MTPVLENPRATVVPEGTARPWTRRSAVLLLGVLLICAVVITRGIAIGEFSYNVDEAQHAVTGLYAAALLHDRPSHPVAYTYNFYAQYPAVGVIHWPPLFYGFEGLSFLILGPGVVAARLAVLLFALFGLWAWFEMVRELQDEWTAAVSTLWLGLLPSLLLFEKTVMLEVPCLSLCLGTALFWTRYLLHQKTGSLVCFVGFASAALLTKQNSIYLALFCVGAAVAVQGSRMFLKPAVWWSAMSVALIAGPYYFLVYRTHWQTAVMNLENQGVSSRTSTWLFYSKALPGQLGWTLLALSTLGLLTSRRWDRGKITLLMLSWIGACYVTFTLIGFKDARYALYWLPPFTYFAAGMLIRLFTRQPLRVIAGVAAAVLLAGSLSVAWSYRRPYVSGYSAAAKAVTQAAPGGIVLYDGELPGNFIFFVSANDPQRHFLVLRKALYAYRIDKQWGSEELIHGSAGIQDLLRRDGVRFVVVSEHMKLEFDVQRALREMLQTKQFKLLGSFPIQTFPQPKGENLLLYENQQWAPPGDKFLRIRMLTLNHDLVVPFSQFELAGTAAAPPDAAAK
jgi:hypothetical protein